MFLGIDGGGSKTGGVIIDSSGCVLAEHITTGSWVVGKPSAKACGILCSLVNHLLFDAGLTRNLITHYGIGLNGIDFDDEIPTQHRDIAAAIEIPAEKLTLVNDGIAALWGATSSPAATILQHGSAFTAAYRSNYGNETLFDHLSVGRTYDLRNELIAAVARMIDGRIASTPLKTSTLKHFQIEDQNTYCQAIFRNQIPRKLLATTAPLIFSAWETGDSLARKLVEKTIDDYATAAQAMANKITTDCVDVIFGGGVVAQAPEKFWEELKIRISRDLPHPTVNPPKHQPHYGAAVMAGFNAGVEPASLYKALSKEEKNE